MARADLAGSDAFYFDASHDQRSQPYTLVNLRAGYAGERWSVHAWGRNVFDERLRCAGSTSASSRRTSPNKLYVQQGDPRQVGVTVGWSLR